MASKEMYDVLDISAHFLKSKDCHHGDSFFEDFAAPPLDLDEYDSRYASRHDLVIQMY